MSDYRDKLIRFVAKNDFWLFMLLIAAMCAAAYFRQHQ